MSLPADSSAVAAYLASAAQGRDSLAAVTAAAEAVADDPWRVVAEAGALARARLRVAEADLGLTRDLRPVAVDARSACYRVAAGQPYPAFDRAGRRRRGAYDTPPDLARRVVRAALQAARGPVTRGLDPACGTGAFLVAMAEAGVAEVEGADLDVGALAVARVAVPRARLAPTDALLPGPCADADVVCGNPPFVAPEQQDKALRADLRRRFPWLRGRFDLVVPFAAAASARVRRGGGLGLVLPYAAFVQPYGAPLRRDWLGAHAITLLEGPCPFPGASVRVGLLAMQIGGGPAALPSGLAAEDLLRLPVVPLGPELRPGDVEIVEAMRACSVPLGEHCVVDTGLVGHSPEGGKARLLRAGPGPGHVPYADAREFFEGRHRWLAYDPPAMHRPKSPALFERDKIVIQRLRGDEPVRVAVDRRGIYVGHTCTVVVPREPSRLDLDRLVDLIRSPLVEGFTRIERGRRLDLYPRDVSAIPLPPTWLEDAAVPLATAFGLRPAEVERLTHLARSRGRRHGEVHDRVRPR